MADNTFDFVKIGLTVSFTLKFSSFRLHFETCLSIFQESVIASIHDSELVSLQAELDLLTLQNQSMMKYTKSKLISMIL